MSLYNMINGVNPATFLILPMLGKHPSEYPRFRDCWAGKTSKNEEVDKFGIPVIHNDPKTKIISIYTRVGGNNREDHQEEIDELRAMPEYVGDFDDDFDNTFATFEFNVPEKWVNDYNLIVENKTKEVSPEYQSEMKRVFPKLAKQFSKFFTK